MESLSKNDVKNLRRRERRKKQKDDTLPKPPKYKCDVCGKMWRTTSEYKSHIATHSDERPYICEICGQAYKHKAALDVHVGMHNGINPFSCPYCNKAFTQKGALQRHLPIHTGEAPYQCELCGKRFVHHTSFNMHTLAHTGQKSYKCKVCGLALLSGSHLKRHSRVHTGERPYQCTTCGKRFAERYNLVAHTRVHDPLGSHSREGHSKKIHRCQLCGANFDRKPKLEDHLALSHNKITESDDNRKWFSHLLGHDLNPLQPGNPAAAPQMHGPPSNPPGNPLGLRRLHGDPGTLLPPPPSQVPTPDHVIGNNSHSSSSSLPMRSTEPQPSWHHMIFGPKGMDGEMLDAAAAIDTQHRLLSEMTTLGQGGHGRNMITSSLMGGHASFVTTTQPLHVPNTGGHHTSLLQSRVNMFSPDHN